MQRTLSVSMGVMSLRVSSVRMPPNTASCGQSRQARAKACSIIWLLRWTFRAAQPTASPCPTVLICWSRVCAILPPSLIVSHLNGAAASMSRPPGSNPGRH
ncbi:hypothetical protein [Catellatospora tritici]|uniref:hypothetical protein n=1 Tax=Catellatospora tritici TaxID=2851566 RepID=UPI001C2DE896|nr:hypothetical protein [Catellatospora tritici]MBV1855732.1 hypothetical protein [Catellatospora tritici]